MGYFIALDAGGTKTETLLLDESGRILLRDISLGCNAMDMGLEEALRRAVFTLRRVAQHIPGGKPDYAFCGIASMNYYGEAMRGPLRAAFADWPLYLEDDGWGMISSMLGQAPGCCIVCGTGCSLFARTPDALYHIGGLGYLIDTVGSGFILGRDAILAAIKQVEGARPQDGFVRSGARADGRRIAGGQYSRHLQRRATLHRLLCALRVRGAQAGGLRQPRDL